MEGGRGFVESQARVLEFLKESLVDRRKRAKEEFQKLVLDARIANIASWIVWLRKRAAVFISGG